MNAFLKGISVPYIKIENAPVADVDGANKAYVDGKITATEVAATPAGGSTGSVLAKQSTSHYDTEWNAAAGGASVFGDDYQYYEHLNNVQLIDDTGVVDKCSFDIVVTTAGYFQLNWKYNWSHNSYNTNVWHEILTTFNSTETVLTKNENEPRDDTGVWGATGTSQRVHECGRQRIYLEVGTTTITFRWQNYSPGKVSSVWDNIFEVYRLTEG